MSLTQEGQQGHPGPPPPSWVMLSLGAEGGGQEKGTPQPPCPVPMMERRWVCQEPPPAAPRTVGGWVAISAAWWWQLDEWAVEFGEIIKEPDSHNAPDNK